MCGAAELPEKSTQSSEEVDSDVVASDSESCADEGVSDVGVPPEELCESEAESDRSREVRTKSTARARSQVRLDRRSKGRAGTLRRAATSPVLDDPVARAQRRVQEQFAARRRAKREERRQKALCQCRYDSVNLEAFRRATAARLANESEDVIKEVSDVGDVGKSVQGGEKAEPALSMSKRRRIAIVGAGPVGLWAANLIMLRHARRVKRPVAGSGAMAAKAAPVFIRSKDAPEIVIFEQRAEEDHCSRRNVRITLDAHAAACLRGL